MPIIGLTDRVESRFPRLGNLRKGAERDAQGRVGKDLDHFRFTSPKPEVEVAFTKAFGKAPREVEVFLPYASVDENFACWKEEWGKSGLAHRCDGQTMTLWMGPDNRYHTEPKPCPGAGKPDAKCTQVGRLSVIIPALVREGHVGYVTMQTGSTYDILGILATLRETARIRGTEDLTGVAFVLRRVEGDVPFVNKEGIRSRVKKWLVQMEPSQRWVLAQIEASQARAMLPDGRAPAEVVDTESGEIIDADAVEVDPNDGAPVAEAAGPVSKYDSEGELIGKSKGDPHWALTPGGKADFLKALQDRKMSVTAALAKLGGIARVSDYHGTMQAALDALDGIAPITAEDDDDGRTPF